MKKELERLMLLLRKKYPENQYMGIVKLIIYCEEHGCICEGIGGEETPMFAFNSIADLVEHLQEK